MSDPTSNKYPDTPVIPQNTSQPVAAVVIWLVCFLLFLGQYDLQFRQQGTHILVEGEVAVECDVEQEQLGLLFV